MKKNFKIIGFIFLAASAIGFLDASYLTIKHFMGDIPPCALAGCETVLTSAQSAVFGVPVALFGALYYLTILILSIVFLDGKKVSVIRYASYFTIAGFLASLYFVYLQLFVIHYICQYCMVSAATSTVLFIAGMFALRKIKKDYSNTETENK